MALLSQHEGNWTESITILYSLIKKAKEWNIQNITDQGFIQAILMSGRRHKKLNLLTEFSTQSSKKFILKHIDTELAYKINYLTKFLLFKLFICPPDVKRPKYFRSFTPETSPGFHHKPVAVLTAPGEPYLHFTTFKKHNLCSKTNISKTTWINVCRHISLSLLFIFSLDKWQFMQ